jgi:hypothetical protein
MAGESLTGDREPVKLHLEVLDPEVAAELGRHSEGPERDRYALGALRLGVLALRQARGELDVQAVRQEGERLVEGVRAALEQQMKTVERELLGSFRQYLDPQTGVLPQRLEHLVRRDGELDHVLARHLSGDSSELARTLAHHVGEQSPLFRLLSPAQADGLLTTLEKSVQAALDQHRTRLTQEFSLDVADSALSRLVTAVTGANRDLTSKLRTDLDAVVRQFSLDDPQSALSRLVGQVGQASEEITAQFSLDLEHSSLSRLRRELLAAVEQLARSQIDFHAEVRATLEGFKARKQEAERSTRHGTEFEVAVCEVLGADARRLGDVFTECGATTGRIRNSKVGDAVAVLGPDSAAPAARIVVEAKAEQGYDLASARAELDTARENRDAQVGLFVFARRVAPAGLEPVSRFGLDVLVVWDPDDPSTDLYVTLGYSVARAIAIATKRVGARVAADVERIDRALLEIARNIEALEEVTISAQTVRNAGDKIERRVRIVREAIDHQLELLKEHVDALKEQV